MAPRANNRLALVVLAVFATALVIVTGLAFATSAEAVPRTAATDATLGGRIESLGKRVRELQGKVDAMQSRENALQSELDAKVARQQQIAVDLAATRSRLTRLRAKLERSKRVLSRRVVGVYKSGEPDYLTVVLQSDGFIELVQRATFLRHVAEQDQAVIDGVQTLKADATQQTTRLAALELESAKLVADVGRRRDSVAAEKNQLAARVAPVAERLRASRARLATVARARARENRPHRQPAGNANPGVDFSPSLTPAGHVTLRSDGYAVAPINAPASIKAAVAAGNRIAKKPYIYGGGHGSFDAAGYDCSGSVSYVLHGAGVLGSPLDSSGLGSWGKPGPGNWITVYGNAGHAMMSVGGVWFDTSGIGANGSRWQGGSKGTGGYAVRHYPGL